MRGKGTRDNLPDEGWLRLPPQVELDHALNNGFHSSQHGFGGGLYFPMKCGADDGDRCAEA